MSCGLRDVLGFEGLDRPAVLVASSARIAEELGWRPARQDLRAIVGDAWAWLQAHPRKYG